MSEEKDIDIVTEPLPKKEKIKDPRRVAAGLALAQKNKEARAALARELAREKAREVSSREESEPEPADSSDTLGSISWQHFIGLGGFIIGAVGLYLQWKKTTPTQVVTDMPSRVEPRIEKHSTPPMV